MVSGHFDRRQFDKKYDLAKKVQFFEMFLAKDNLTNADLLKRQFGEINSTKIKVQQIFVAKNTIRRNISIQFQIFC